MSQRRMQYAEIDRARGERGFKRGRVHLGEFDRHIGITAAEDDERLLAAPHRRR